MHVLSSSHTGHTHYSSYSPTGSAMSDVPKDLFRRAMTHRGLEEAENLIQTFVDRASNDNPQAMRAGLYGLAAMIAKELDRPDLVEEFVAKREEFIDKAKNVQPMRRRKKKVQDEGGESPHRSDVPLTIARGNDKRR